MRVSWPSADRKPSRTEPPPGEIWIESRTSCSLERGIPMTAREPEHQSEAEGSVLLLVDQRLDDGMGLVNIGLAGTTFCRDGDAQKSPIEVDVPFLQPRTDA